MASRRGSGLAANHENNMSEKHFVTVIVPTYHDWGRLELCIAALEAQSYPTESYEVIIVNNDPLDHAPELHLLENFRLISEAKPGSYAARNAALALAKGAIIAFTDSDCIPDKDWLTNAVARLESGAERVAGHVELFFESETPTFSELYEKLYAFDQASNAKKGAGVTANMITWRKHFDTVGWFTDSLMSGGDVEWGWRANSLGIPIVYAPEVLVKHPARNHMAAILQKRRRVALGALNIDREEIRQHFLMLLIRGYLPPVRALLKAWRSVELTFTEKLVVMSLAYYFKIYETTYSIGLRLGINRHERA